MVISDDQLKQLLLKFGLVSDKELTELVNISKNSNVPLYESVLEKDIISDDTLGLMVSDFLKIPFIRLSQMSIPEAVFNLIPEKTARKQKVIAFEKGEGGIKLAMVDPTNVYIQETLQKKTGQKIIPHLTTERDLFNTFHLYRKDLQKTFDKLVKQEMEAEILGEVEGAPIAKIVDLIVESAYQDKTSDIHIEPEEKTSLVRFRIDGILHDVLFFPKELHEQIITRIKILSRLRTDEHFAPQDGKMRIRLDEEILDIRVSILPVTDGEKVVLRLLASHFTQFSLIDLGMNEQDLKKVSSASSKSYGMILSTGPTGSGKTTSIYSILKILNTREKNITTIEDPVEYKIKGVNQIQANTKTNLTFASGLRSILRQDPNIIFVGEIRDSETAGIAVNAALTGHLVLSTLHTNDAATALPRLTDMKVEPFLVASTVNVIVAQRLVRKICDICKTAVTITHEELAKNIPSELIKKNLGLGAEIRMFKGKGCRACHSTGYTGRIGIFEVLEVSNQVRKLITEKNDSDVIVKTAVAEGMTTMLDDGLQKAGKGLTSIEEVLRVTKVESM